MEPPDKAASWRVQKPAGMYGRLLLGASAVLYGVVSLIWRDSDMWQRLLPIHGQAGTFAARSLDSGAAYDRLRKLIDVTNRIVS